MPLNGGKRKTRRNYKKKTFRRKQKKRKTRRKSRKSKKRRTRKKSSSKKKSTRKKKVRTILAKQRTRMGRGASIDAFPLHMAEEDVQLSVYTHPQSNAIIHHLNRIWKFHMTEREIYDITNNTDDGRATVAVIIEMVLEQFERMNPLPDEEIEEVD